MKIIYLDTLFFVNFLFDYFLLLCTAKCSGAVIRRISMAIAGCLGGVYACLTVLPALPWAAHPAVKLCLGVLLCLVAFGKEQKLYRCILFFLCTSALFGGIFSALSLSVNGVTYLPINGKTVVLTFAVVYFVLSLFFRRLPQLQKQQTLMLTISFRGKALSCTALHDTGNTLYDPITNLPVIICDGHLLRSLFPELREIGSDPYTLFFLLSELPDCKHRMKLIPYQTIDKQGFLLGFKPDALTVDGKPEEYYIAFSPTTFSAHHTYQAII